MKFFINERLKIKSKKKQQFGKSVCNGGVSHSQLKCIHFLSVILFNVHFRFTDDQFIVTGIVTLIMCFHLNSLVSFHLKGNNFVVGKVGDFFFARGKQLHMFVDILLSLFTGNLNILTIAFLTTYLYW